MFIIYHGVSSSSDVRALMFAGFSAGGFFHHERSALSVNQIASLINIFPPFVPSLLTAHGKNVNELIAIAKAANPFVLCVMDGVATDGIIAIRKALPNIKVMQLFSYNMIVRYRLYKARVTLSQADGVMINFAGCTESTIMAGTYLEDIVNNSRAPVFFAGISKMEILERLIHSCHPYGVLVDRELFTKRGVNLIEGVKALKLSSLGRNPTINVIKNPHQSSAQKNTSTATGKGLWDKWVKKNSEGSNDDLSSINSKKPTKVEKKDTKDASDIQDHDSEAIDAFFGKSYIK